MKKLIITLLFIFAMLFTSAQRKPIGTYRSNFADLGFFITKINFTDNSTFMYHFGGDLMHDNSQGTFTVRKDTVFLHFVDSIKSTSLNDTLANIVEEISSGRHLRPAKYLFKNGKLWIFHIETGKVVRNAVAYNKLKKYLLFGSHYYKRRHYLKKID